MAELMIWMKRLRNIEDKVKTKNNMFHHGDTEKAES